MTEQFITDQINSTLEADISDQLEIIVPKIEGTPLRIATEDIIPDPNQPRKTFDELAILELAASAKKYGIIQSLTLRKKGDKYMIVAGERRWRAATHAGLHDVPAMVIEASDEQVLALQLVENLQREDVPIMEQAVKYRQMAEQCHMNTAEIAMAVGKTEYFVRQQIKLTDLTPKWQTMVAKQAISTKIALQIAVFPSDVQKLIYENVVSKEEEKAEKPSIHLNSNILSKYSGIFSNAVFDITDTTLDKKMGACTNCPFNSASYCMFPDENKHPKCNNIGCFNNKTSIHIKIEFEKAKQDPSIVFVYKSYSSMPDEVKTLKEEGLEIFKMGYSDDCIEMVKPKKQAPEEYEQWAKRQGMKKKQIQQGYAKDVKKYESDIAAFDKHVSTGKFKKAFIVYDYSDKYTGRYTWVQLNEKKTTTAQETQQKITSGKATLDDINAERTRLQEREKRYKQLDTQKVQTKISEALDASEKFNKTVPKAINKIDESLLVFLLLQSLSYSSRNKILAVMKLPDYTKGNGEKFFKAINSLSKQQVSFLLYQIMMDKYGNNLPDTEGGFMLRKMAESLNIVPIETFEKEQKAEAEKRQLRLKDRITSLNDYEKKIKGNSNKKPAPVKQLSHKQQKAA
jgi:ParB family transcriptional regulator, chromosome partitioning protein